MKQNLTTKLLAIACLATGFTLSAATPPPSNPAALKLEAASFPLEDTGYYLDQGKWLAINPNQRKTARARQAFPFPSGHYDVTLEAVGEEVGKSTYTVAVKDQMIGRHECPIGPSPMEEGA